MRANDVKTARNFICLVKLHARGDDESLMDSICAYGVWKKRDREIDKVFLVVLSAGIGFC